MGIKSLIMILASLSFSISALAQEAVTTTEESGEKKPFSIYGDLATSIQFMDNEGATTATSLNPNGNHGDFNVNLVEINLEKNWSKSKLHLSLGFGSTANYVNHIANESGGLTDSLNIMNAYYEMNSSYGLGFRVGKFETPMGHEDYNHMDNAQFTRSYGFSLAPFFSTGGEVNYGQDNMWKVGFIVANGRGLDSDEFDKNKTMALVVDVNPIEQLKIDLNYVTGTEAGPATGAPAATVNNQVNILDVSVAYVINEMFDVAVNYIDNGSKAATAVSQDVKATSIAGYVNANFGMFGLGLRYEQFSFDSGAGYYNRGATLPVGITGTDNSINSITLAAKAEIDQNAVAMLEYRMDSGDDANTWFDKNGAATDSNNTITAALMYRF